MINNQVCAGGGSARLCIRLRHRREYDPDRKPGRVVAHLERGAVQTGNRRNKTQAETIAGRATAALQPIEALQHAFTLRKRNTRPIVGDGHDGDAVVEHDLERNPAARSPMLDRVVDQVGKRVKQQIAITGNEQVVLTDDLEAPAAFLGGRIEQLRNIACHLREIEAAERRRARIRLNLRDARERGEHGEDSIEISQRIGDQVRIAGPGA